MIDFFNNLKKNQHIVKIVFFLLFQLKKYYILYANVKKFNRLFS